MDRPKRATPEMKHAAAKKVVDALLKEGKIDADQMTDSIADIVKHGDSFKDGYEIARDLERYAHWECDMQIAKTLDAFSHYLDQEIRNAEKAWAAETNPQPQFKNGDRVKLKSGETGKVDGIYEFGAAKYLVKIDGDPEANSKTKSRRIVNFEDAQAA